jgi:hypothetical protein
LSSKLVVTVFFSFALKLVGMVFSGLASKPVVMFSVWASKPVTPVW